MKDKITENSKKTQEYQDILNQQLDENELDAVSGATEIRGVIAIGSLRSEGSGNCSSSYYKGDCTATVEFNSLCASDDYCTLWDSTYEKVK